MLGNLETQAPLDLCLLSLIFEDNRGLAQINDRAMEALTLSFNQREKLIDELTKYVSCL